MERLPSRLLILFILSTCIIIHVAIQAEGALSKNHGSTKKHELLNDKGSLIKNLLKRNTPDNSTQDDEQDSHTTTPGDMSDTDKTTSSSSTTTQANSENSSADTPTKSGLVDSTKNTQSLIRQTRATTTFKKPDEGSLSSFSSSTTSSSSTTTTTTAKPANTKASANDSAMSPDSKENSGKKANANNNKDDGENDKNSSSKITKSRKGKEAVEEEDEEEDEDDNEQENGKKDRKSSSSKILRKSKHRDNGNYDDDSKTNIGGRHSKVGPNKKGRNQNGSRKNDRENQDEELGDEDDEPEPPKRKKGSHHVKNNNNNTDNNNSTQQSNNNNNHLSLTSIPVADNSTTQQIDNNDPGSGGNQTGLSSQLDGRSPGFGKRFNDNKQNNKQPKQQPTTTTTQSPPTTTQIQTVARNNSSSSSKQLRVPHSEGIYVQIMNQTIDETINKHQQIRATNLTSDLDWSKLVKVVFKSALDNQTLYTIVMNSSELNKHPINDWSMELPHLLERDFEKLVDKWSTVFPPDHLLTDISKIIFQRVSLMPNSSLTANRINETLSSKLNIMFRNNLTEPFNLLSSSGESNTNTTLRPLSDLIKNSNNNNTNITSALVVNANGNDSSPSGRFEVSTQIGLDSRNNSLFNSSSPKPISFWTNNNNNIMNSTSIGNGKTQLKWPQSSSLNETKHIAPSDSVNKTSNSRKSVGNSHVENTAQILSNNKSLVEMVHGMNVEHVRIESNVKEQADSLRNFIILCSIASVIGTSMVVAIIIFLFKR